MHVTLTLPLANLEALVNIVEGAATGRVRLPLADEAVYAIKWAIAERRREIKNNADFREFWERNQHLDFGNARATFDAIKEAGERLQAEARILAAWRREDEALARAEEAAGKEED